MCNLHEQIQANLFKIAFVINTTLANGYSPICNFKLNTNITITHIQIFIHAF